MPQPSGTAWVVWVCVLFLNLVVMSMYLSGTLEPICLIVDEIIESEREARTTSLLLHSMINTNYSHRSICLPCSLCNGTTNLTPFHFRQLVLIEYQTACALLLSAHKIETCDIATAISISISDFNAFFAWPILYLFIYYFLSLLEILVSRLLLRPAHTRIKWKKKILKKIVCFFLFREISTEFTWRWRGSEYF